MYIAQKPNKRVVNELQGDGGQHGKLGLFGHVWCFDDTIEHSQCQRVPESKIRE
jgi:hypothetical protein